MDLFTNANFDFLGKRKVAAILSIILILVGLFSIIFHHGLRLGIDFQGGTLLQLQFDNPVRIGEIRSAMEAEGFANAEIQRFGAEEEVIIRVQQTSGGGNETPDRIQAALSNTLPDNPFQVRRTEEVGPQIGSELRGKAVLAILSAMLGMVIYITLRFELKFAVAAITAIAHDVLITLGVFSVLNLEINLPIIAAFLTIVGYSLNDTIVIFDRVRENLKSLRREAYNTLINLSINQTLSRTVVTSVTTFLVVFILWMWGGEVIQNFALALVIGVITGTYSTIYIASPVVVEWESRSKSAGKLQKRR